MNSSLLFVYGTLKLGGDRHHEIAEKARLVSTAKIQGRLFRIRGELYPGAFPGDSGDYIQGELYRLATPSETLKWLDEIEGCKQGLFTRQQVDVWQGNRKMKAWVYFYNCEKEKAGRIAGGNFSSRQMKRPRI